jgi:preprotein translocase subunit SecY
MWIGEQITEHGIGNGISIILSRHRLASADHANSLYIGITNHYSGVELAEDSLDFSASRQS